MNIQFSKLVLALSVILAFSASGIAIAFRSLPFFLIALLAGFALMGLGIAKKRKQANQVDPTENSFT